MFEADMPVFAVRGEAGTDLFRRVEDAGTGRARFQCLATLDDAGQLHAHLPEARAQQEALRACALGLDELPLARPLSLADARDWAGRAGTQPLALFLHLEFFRAWQVSDLAAARFEARLAAEPDWLPEDPGLLVGAVAPLLSFNRIGRGRALAALAQPRLARRIAAPGFRETGAGNFGYALRMLGDLCLRGADAARALACFETCCATGDNPFRRRRAIEAARAAADAEALARNRAAFSARWPLPADLAETPPGDAA